MALLLTSHEAYALLARMGFAGFPTLTVEFAKAEVRFTAVDDQLSIAMKASISANAFEEFSVTEAVKLAINTSDWVAVFKYANAEFMAKDEPRVQLRPSTNGVRVTIKASDHSTVSRNLKNIPAAVKALPALPDPRKDATIDVDAEVRRVFAEALKIFPDGAIVRFSAGSGRGIKFADANDPTYSATFHRPVVKGAAETTVSLYVLRYLADMAGETLLTKETVRVEKRGMMFLEAMGGQAQIRAWLTPTVEDEFPMPQDEAD